jgi:hypothetical protein
VEQHLKAVAYWLAYRCGRTSWRAGHNRHNQGLDLRRWESRLGDSNSRPTHYECVALPTELRRRASHGPAEPGRRATG